MFLLDRDIPIKLLSVLELSWDHVHGRVNNRPFAALCIREVGAATFLREGEEPICVEEGEITYAPAGRDFEKHAGVGRILVVHFTAQEPLPDRILHFKPRNSAAFVAEFRRLYQVWSRKQFGFELEAKMLFYKILLAIEREWEAGTPGDSRLARAHQYIHEHFADRDLSVEALARLSSMSDTYFRRLFVREYGATPLVYINRLRLTLAMELLRSNYYAIDEVAERCGFNNIHYFSYFIKKETGHSPRDCRRLLLAGEDIPKGAKSPDVP